jgi:hypothetical protein
LRCGLHTSAYASADQLLDDYFSSENLKTHIASQTYARFGLGGDEAGCVGALQGVANAWPLKRSSAAALSAVFEKLCSAGGVQIFRGPISSCAQGRGGAAIFEFANGESVTAKIVCASSPANAENAGFPVIKPSPALRRRHGAEAGVTLRYESAPSMLNAPDDALYFMASTRMAVRSARNAMIEGDIPDELPLVFEIDGDVINVSTQFCPSRIRDGETLRDWSGQDKQAFGRQVAAQIAKFLNKDCGPPVKTTVTLGAGAGPAAPSLAGGAPAVAAPPPSLDPVSASAKLVLELLGHE